MSEGHHPNEPHLFEGEREAGSVHALGLVREIAASTSRGKLLELHEPAPQILLHASDGNLQPGPFLPHAAPRIAGEPASAASSPQPRRLCVGGACGEGCNKPLIPCYQYRMAHKRGSRSRASSLSRHRNSAARDVPRDAMLGERRPCATKKQFTGFGQPAAREDKCCELDRGPRLNESHGCHSLSFDSPLERHSEGSS